jgi:hypothetical protein
MIRVGADGREQALREPNARPMLLGGRVLSGFICIEPAGYAADDALAGWVRRGLDFVSGLPAKPVRNRTPVSRPGEFADLDSHRTAPGSERRSAPGRRGRP